MGEPMYEQDRAWSHLCWLEFCRCTSNYFDVASPMYIWYHMHVPVLHSTLHMWYMCVHVHHIHIIWYACTCTSDTEELLFHWLVGLVGCYCCLPLQQSSPLWCGKSGDKSVNYLKWLWNGWFLLPLEQLSTLSSEKLLATFNLVVGSWK